MPVDTLQFKNGYALLIGVGNYPFASPLPVTVNDATVLYRLLTNPNRAGYPGDQVRLLVNEAASRQGILDGLDWLGKCAANDPAATVFIYFSGHGVVTPDNRYLLAPFEFNRNDRNTVIWKDEFAKKLEGINTRRQVIILDCCHAAGITTKSGEENNFKPDNQVLYDELTKGGGRVVMASSRHDEVSRILPNARYSVFTDALIQALDGKGSNDKNYATVLRMLPYVNEYVVRETKGRQTPVFNLDDLQDFSICRVNMELAQKQSFTKTADYLGAVVFEEEANTYPGELHSFVSKIRSALDEQGFAAVSEVLDEIKQCGFNYNKPAFANLRNDALNPLTALAPNEYITRLKVFIGMLS